MGPLNSGQSINSITGTQGADISAPDAWKINSGSDSVTIAIIDTGIDITHPDLRDNIWTNSGEIPETVSMMTRTAMSTMSMDMIFMPMTPLRWMKTAMAHTVPE